MELQDHPLKVAPTAALVLSYAHSLYTRGLAKTYFEQLDLAEGKALAAKLPTEAGGLVCCRKRFIRHQLEQFLDNEDPVQVAILGAGLDPLSLHLLEFHREAVHSIYEVDADHLRQKEQHYHTLLPARQPVRFIQADMNDTLHLPDLLRDAGYSFGRPAIIIFEGVAHYMSDEQFLNLMQLFRTPNKTNVVFMDYTLPEYAMSPASRPVFKAVKKQIESLVGRPLSVYSRPDIFQLVEMLQGDVAGVDSMKDMEFKLNGRNERYHEEGEGLIEMISFYL
ncbi:class I SAM-dependent methyltransferase [Chitinophaga sp. XS-30]|uniref:class I SAM-dependent methyltransferase n=1 Tax=Chitinophaga sp. XS-30 TaxID=2604421 RepID=UPI0011DD00A3|nr:class I SAM-dependent methyltransferase [Chitinophaga sp. XS-30]QEH40570.1 class I SAM-dependent methyltransferase [Chitinophaga sp. XS-30]